MATFLLTFIGSIRDNILLGLDVNTIADDQVHDACRDALIHDFIVSLPGSYNTDVGSGGVALSGGQKQRISIARALVCNPRILLLDEATSSLDSESERLVQAALERAAKGRTLVVVAHRLSTVQNADVIFVLGEDGQILEKGSHLELLGKRGVYDQMVSFGNIRFGSPDLAMRSSQKMNSVRIRFLISSPMAHHAITLEYLVYIWGLAFSRCLP